MYDKTDYHWNILNESSSSYIFSTEWEQAFVCCPRLDLICENSY